MDRSDEIREHRSALIRQELAIDALGDRADGLDDGAASALHDEIASLTAELDQDWADWAELRDAHEAAVTATRLLVVVPSSNEVVRGLVEL